VGGFVLYYLEKHQDAADQFHHASLVDPDDVEPVLWRYLVRFFLNEEERREGGREGGRVERRMLRGVSLCPPALNAPSSFFSPT